MAQGKACYLGACLLHLVRDHIPVDVQRGIHDYVPYAEMYSWLLTEPHDKGRLPQNWRHDIKVKFPEL